jgi:hypothetical protein
MWCDIKSVLRSINYIFDTWSSTSFLYYDSNYVESSSIDTHKHFVLLFVIYFTESQKNHLPKKNPWQFCCLVRRFSIGLRKFFLGRKQKASITSLIRFYPLGYWFFITHRQKAKKFFLLSRTAKRDNSNILVHCFRISNLRHIIWPFWEKER